MSKNKIVIVTGNGSGIGHAIAERLDRDGFRIVGTHHEGERVYDVSEYSSLMALFAKIHGPIYGLVNNAGVLDADDFGDITMDDFEYVMHTNVLAPLWLSEMAYERGVQSIVNITGLYGKTGAYGNKPIYAASKAALNNITLTLSRSLAPVRVNAVLPGIIPTGIHQVPHPEHGHSCLGRLGTPKDVAGAVSWLMSKDAAYVTGALIEVAGGR